MHSPSASTICQTCHFEQNAQYNYCGNCGQSVWQHCTRCKQSLPPEFRFCGFCGEGLQALHDHPAPPLSPQPLRQVPLQAPTKAPAKTGAEATLKVPQAPKTPQQVPITAAPQTPVPLPVEAAPTPVAHSAVARVSERRQVAVLFCDICGFTALSESLDPEEVSNIIQPLFQQCNAIIGKYEGVVEKFIGDAIMALFGVPFAHEDDPERAALAALEMRDLIQNFGKELEKEHGRSINMRMGLHLGTVVAGSVEALEGRNYQVMGDVINTAARMEQNAKPGHILVTEEMYRLLQESFELKTDTLIQAKGKAKPLQAYELVGIRRLQQARRGLQAQNEVWVGRQEELARLMTLAETRLHTQTGTLLQLRGESGIGKTRLIQELYLRLKESQPDLHLIQACSTSYSTNFPYFMLQGLIRSLLGQDENSSHFELHGQLSHFLESLKLPNAEMVISLLESLLFPHLEFPQLKLIPPERLQKQIFRAVADVLHRLSRQCTLFIQIDDLQWCDPLSLMWLTEFQDNLPNQPFPGVICLTQRAEESRSGQAAISAHPIQTDCDLDLSPLPPSECQALFCKILNIDPQIPLPDELGALGQAILNRAAGKPYYIEEVLKNLLEDQILQKNEQEKWHLTCSLRDLPLPNSIQRLIMARFDRLEAHQRQLLQTVSAMGAPVSQNLLEILFNDTSQEADLLSLHQAGLLKSEMGPHGAEYSFFQALTQEVIYNTMVKRRRRVLHKRIGETIERLYSADPYPMLDLLAYHFSRSEETLKAIKYLYLSADRSSRLFANTQALEAYAHIFEILAPLERNSLIAVDLQSKEWRRPAQLEHEILQKKAEILFRTGAYERLMKLVEKYLKTDLPLLEQARLMYWQGRGLEKRSEFAKARECFDAALKLMENQTDPREQARFWNACGWVNRWLGEYETALQACQTALKLLETQPDMEQIAYAHNVMGVVHYYRHEWEASLEHYRQGLEIQEQIQDLWGHANSLSNMGNVYFLTNRWQEAVGVFRESLKIREQLSDLEGISTSCNNLGHACLALGKLELAEKYLLRARSLFEQLKQTVGAAVAQCNLGLVAMHRQQWQAALELLEPGILALEKQNMQVLLPELYNYRSEIYLELDDFKAAENLEAIQNPVIEQHGDPIQKGRRLRLKGLYFLLTGQPEAAQGPLKEALAILQPTGHEEECKALYENLITLHETLGLSEVSYWQQALKDLLAAEKPLQSHLH